MKEIHAEKRMHQEFSRSFWKPCAKNLDKDKYAYHYQKGYWKVDCMNKESKANVDSTEDEDSDEALTISLTARHSNEWILDSNCSYQMCLNKDLFSSLMDFNGEVVYMRNNSACKIQGIGLMCLKMFDGTIRCLTDVRNVLEKKLDLLRCKWIQGHRTRTHLEGRLRCIGCLVVMQGTRSGAYTSLMESWKYCFQGKSKEAKMQRIGTCECRAFFNQKK